jgi:hypothetical protein
VSKKLWRKPEVKQIVAGAAEAGCSGKTGATTDASCTTKS